MLKIPYYNINTPREISTNPFISYHFKGISYGLRGKKKKPKGKRYWRKGERLDKLRGEL